MGNCWRTLDTSQASRLKTRLLQRLGRYRSQATNVDTRRARIPLLRSLAIPYCYGLALSQTTRECESSGLRTYLSRPQALRTFPPSSRSPGTLRQQVNTLLGLLGLRYRVSLSRSDLRCIPGYFPGPCGTLAYYQERPAPRTPSGTTPPLQPASLYQQTGRRCPVPIRLHARA